LLHGRPILKRKKEIQTNLNKILFGKGRGR